jgi:sigma-B regulation protein RsbU (phosphoserine phosphatase)
LVLIIRANSLMTSKILYVDDERDLELLITQNFRRQIRDGIYQFEFAQNGEEALRRLEQDNGVTIVLSDINMPVMDGLTLLARINELKKPSLKTVIISAYGDMENIRTAMNRGAFDFITKPINFEDLQITINKTIEEALFLRKSLEDHEKLLALESDLNIARNIQMSIIPKEFPVSDKFELYASMRPARQVGGDFYDFFMIDENRLAIVIADVCDKGVSAALFMAVSRTIIKSMGIKGYPADDCLTHANNLLCSESKGSCMFVTVFYGILNLQTGEFEYSNGGHNPPLLIRKNGSVIETETTENTVIGYLEGHKFNSRKIKLEPGDTLYTYTDGVTETMNTHRELYGQERLAEVLSKLADKSPQEINDTIESELTNFADGYYQSDDITMLVLKYGGVNW